MSSNLLLLIQFLTSILYVYSSPTGYHHLLDRIQNPIIRGPERTLTPFEPLVFIPTPQLTHDEPQQNNNNNYNYNDNYEYALETFGSGSVESTTEQIEMSAEFWNDFFNTHCPVDVLDKPLPHSLALKSDVDCDYLKLAAAESAKSEFDMKITVSAKEEPKEKTRHKQTKKSSSKIQKKKKTNAKRKEATMENGRKYGCPLYQNGTRKKCESVFNDRYCLSKHFHKVHNVPREMTNKLLLSYYPLH